MTDPTSSKVSLGAKNGSVPGSPGADTSRANSFRAMLADREARWSEGPVSIEDLATPIRSIIDPQANLRREIVRGMPEPLYHGPAPCSVPALSHSLATVLDNASPAHAYDRHPALGGAEHRPSAAMSIGTLIHALLLERGEIVIVAADSYQTKAARAARDEAIAAGRVPVLPHEYEAALIAVDALRSELARRGIELAPPEDREVSLFWPSQDANGEVIQCKARLDSVADDPSGFVEILDLKTIAEARPERCAEHADRYGYAIQHAAYLEAVSELYDVAPEAIRFRFLFFEPTPPYVLTVAELDRSFVALGSRRWERAKLVWARCLSSNDWPGYSNEIVQLTPPTWALRREEDRANEEQ